MPANLKASFPRGSRTAIEESLPGCHLQGFSPQSEASEYLLLLKKLCRTRKSWLDTLDRQNSPTFKLCQKASNSSMSWCSELIWEGWFNPMIRQCPRLSSRAHYGSPLAFRLGCWMCRRYVGLGPTYSSQDGVHLERDLYCNVKGNTRTRNTAIYGQSMCNN